MKNLLLFLFFLISYTAIGQDLELKPNPPRLVNDYAHVLSPDQKETLESKLVAYDDSTSTQIAIIIIDTTNGYDVQTIALKYLREWGIGNKNNNGIVILAAIKDRKIRIETGYGMEGVLPDITAQQIIDNEIKPSFRQENYYRGLDEATTAIFKAAAGEYKAPENYNKKGKSGRSFGLISFIVLFIIISLISRGGGRGGGLMSRRGFGPFIIGSMLGSGSSGGGWSGGGGGFGGGGGGFGGFGGGSGGGGGASGSW